MPESAVAIDALHVAPNRLVTMFKPTKLGLYVIESDGGPSQLRFIDRAGKSSVVPLPPVASVKGIVPLPGNEVLIQLETFLQPIGWYRYVKGAEELKRTALFSTSTADFSDCEVVRNSQPPRMGPKCL